MILHKFFCKPIYNFIIVILTTKEYITFRTLLPNWGFGYRWEFKKNVNVRLDYGFGKPGHSGFIFNINEAF